VAENTHWALRHPDATLSALGFFIGFLFGAVRSGPAVGLVLAIVCGLFTVLVSHQIRLGPQEGPHQ
jgi:hypothetical protein